MSTPDNPYAAPLTSGEAVVTPEPLGMPPSVRIAIGCLCLFALLYIRGLVEAAFGAPLQFGEDLLPFVVVAALIGGLWRRVRFARRAARLSAFFGAVLLTGFLAVAVWALFIRDEAVATGGSWLGVNWETRSELATRLMFVGEVGAMAASQWVAAIALGRLSARRYFEPPNDPA